jgi:hypothetical protein
MIKKLGYLFIVTSVLFSCNTNPLNVDVSDIELAINYHRFDQKLASAKNVNELEQVHKELHTIGGELYEFYTIEMLRVGAPNDDSTVAFLYKFIKDSTMQLVQKAIDSTFGDFSKEKEQITNAFKHLKYHIPHVMLPSDVITYNSTYANGVISAPSQIGIGLEMYLGPNNQIIKRLPFPEYFKARMDRQFLLSDVAQSWVTTNVIENQMGDDFLSHLIYYGKVLYTMEAMLPNSPPHQIIKYNELEYEWAEVSEYDIWQFIVEQEWVYSKDMKLMVRYFNEGPTTVGLEGSPARIGQFLGWKIVKSYMTKYPETTLIDLIAEKNQGKILKAYKPKKK